MSQQRRVESAAHYVARVATASTAAVVIFATTLDPDLAALMGERISDSMKGGMESLATGRTLEEKWKAGECPDQRREKRK